MWGTSVRPSNRKRTAMGAGVVLLALGASACTGGGGSSSNSGASSGGGSNDVLSAVLKRGEVRVADCLSFAPFGFYDKSGNPKGYDVDIAKEMAKQLGVKLKTRRHYRRQPNP